MRMRRIAASLLAVLFLSRILSGCAGTPEIRERELPADRERLEQCLKELDLGFVVGGEDSFGEGHILHYLNTPEGQQAAMAETYDDGEHRYSRVTLYAPRGNIAGVPAGEEMAFYQLACDLYADGLDAAVFSDGFQRQVDTGSGREETDRNTDVQLLEQQGEVYALLTLTCDEEGLRWQTLWLGNRAVYDDGMKERLERYLNRSGN